MPVALTFDCASVTPFTGGGFFTFEAGVYDVVILSTEEKTIKDKPGLRYLEITNQVLTGPAKGEKYIDRLNLWHDEQATVSRAYAQLSAIGWSCGVPAIHQSTAELHGKPYKLELSKTERKDKPGSYNNNVVVYMNSAGHLPGGGSKSAAPAAAPAPAPAPAPVAATVAAPTAEQIAAFMAAQAAQAAAAAAPAAAAPADGVPSWAQ